MEQYRRMKSQGDVDKFSKRPCQTPQEAGSGSGRRRRKSYRCVFCHFECCTLETLGRHQSLHSRERRYSCTACGWRFHTAAHVEQHQRAAHQALPPCCCRLCGARTAGLHALQAHMRKHDVRRRHACAACGVRYLTAKMLSLHAKVAHGGGQQQQQGGGGGDDGPVIKEKEAAVVGGGGIVSKTRLKEKIRRRAVRRSRRSQNLTGRLRRCASEAGGGEAPTKRQAGSKGPPPPAATVTTGEKPRLQKGGKCRRRGIVQQQSPVHVYTKHYSKDVIVDIGRQGGGRPPSDLWFKMELAGKPAAPQVSVKLEPPDSGPADPLTCVWAGEGFNEVMGVKQEKKDVS